MDTARDYESLSAHSPDSTSETHISRSDTILSSTHNSRDSTLLQPGSERGSKAGRSHATPSISHTSSPLKWSSPSKAGSLGALQYKRNPSEEARAFSQSFPRQPSVDARASMILYRLFDDDTLSPPTFPNSNRASVVSSSRDSVLSLSSDSKYPATAFSGHAERGFVAYAFDPTMDEEEEEGDAYTLPGRTCLSPRGIANVVTLGLVIIGVVSLFLAYPVVSHYQHNNVELLIASNPAINSSGQAVDLVQDIARRGGMPLQYVSTVLSETISAY